MTPHPAAFGSESRLKSNLLIKFLCSLYRGKVEYVQETHLISRHSAQLSQTLKNFIKRLNSNCENPDKKFIQYMYSYKLSHFRNILLWILRLMSRYIMRCTYFYRMKFIWFKIPFILFSSNHRKDRRQNDYSTE